MTHLVPLYLKMSYKTDPIFAKSKIVLSLYDEVFKEKFSSGFVKKAMMQGVVPADMDVLGSPNGINLAKLAVKYADGVILGSNNVNKEVLDYVAKRKLPTLPYSDINAGNASYANKYIKFYDKLLKV